MDINISTRLYVIAAHSHYFTRDSEIYDPPIIVERRAERTGIRHTFVSLRSSAMEIVDVFYDDRAHGEAQ